MYCSSFEDHSQGLFRQDTEAPQYSYNCQDEVVSVPDPRLKPIKTAPSSCAFSPLKCTSIDKESVQPNNTSCQNDETDELVIFKIVILSLSLAPLTSKEIVDRFFDKAHEVVRRYLP